MAEALPSASLPFRSLWFSAILPPLVLADHSAKVTLFGLVGSRSRSQGDDGRLCSAVSSTHHLCATSHLVSNDGIRGSPQKRRRAREELCYGRDDEGSQAGVVFPVPLELRRALHEGERAHREDRGRPRQPAQRGLRVRPLGAGSLERLRVQPQPPEEAAQARGRARRGQMGGDLLGSGVRRDGAALGCAAGRVRRRDALLPRGYVPHPVEPALQVHEPVRQSQHRRQRHHLLQLRHVAGALHLRRLLLRQV